MAYNYGHWTIAFNMSTVEELWIWDPIGEVDENNYDYVDYTLYNKCEHPNGVIE
jgi:hypothetical protein